jgi:hypothetical protein
MIPNIPQMALEETANDINILIMPAISMALQWLFSTL